MIRPVQGAGPRSVISTLHERLLVRLVTMTLVPNGSVRCAAVIRVALKTSPLLVVLPTCRPPSYDARPSEIFVGPGETAFAVVVVAGTVVQAPRHRRPGKMNFNTILSSLMFARGDEQELRPNSFPVGVT